MSVAYTRLLSGIFPVFQKDIALVETFGPNPDLTFRTLNETYAQKAEVDQQDIALVK